VWEIKTKLFTINTFRNILAHANWQTLTKTGFVRSKLRFNDDDGQVEFKIVQMKPSTIRSQIIKLLKLSNNLVGYVEKTLDE
jgi:hypothetical protein